MAAVESILSTIFWALPAFHARRAGDHFRPDHRCDNDFRDILQRPTSNTNQSNHVRTALAGFLRRAHHPGSAAAGRDSHQHIACAYARPADCLAPRFGVIFGSLHRVS